MHLLKQLKEFASLSFRPVLLSIIPLYALLARNAKEHKWNQSVVGFFLIAVPALLGLGWQAAVALRVPEPYLDEVFHIPQAQKYCLGRWSEWDDKITTPPGLYVASILIQRGLWFMTGGCSETSLRMTNWLATLLLGFTAMQCRRLLEARLSEQRTGEKRSASLSIYVIHTGMNIGLCPLLFFFSALYYTDVFSTLAVLLAFQNHLERVTPQGKSWLSDVWTIGLGVTALFMRQTNVFWVVVFMGGLEAVHAIKTLPLPSNTQGWVHPKDAGLVELVKYYASLCSSGYIHDPSLNLVSLDDVLFLIISIAAAVLCNPLRVLRQVWPHVVVMGLFVAFVLWNGSVVLGDKSNHVATIHLPQMLYIWPLFTFFSAPLMIPFVMLLFPFIWDTYSRSQSGEVLSKQAQEKHRKVAKQDEDLSKIQELYRTYGKYLNLTGFAALIPVALAIVHFNTIIHPFTLADNRHYMFYVFRYSILRAKWVRYALAPIYVLCWAMCWKVVEGCRPNYYKAQDEDCPVARQKLGGCGFINRPSVDLSIPFPSTQDAVRRQLASLGRQSGKRDSNSSPEITTHALHGYLVDSDGASTSSPSLSTALLWAVTTALSLVTAPLVEPRYFILPWVFWRLLMPAWPAHTCHKPCSESSHPQNFPGSLGKLFQLGRNIDVRLILETGWFILIHLVTAYMFITRPFYWRAEDGTLLDGGRVQRFMW